MTKLTFGSLFTGIGGFDLGFEQAGLTPVWQCEIDKYCRRILHKQYSDVYVYEDIKNVTDVPPVNILCGGFPCQDLSVAGKRAGFKGKRSSLWWEFYRVIKEVKSEWVIIENVTGLLTSNQGRDFGAILFALDELGYHVGWRVLNSQFFGVPQRRRRVFIVGYLGNAERVRKVLFESEISDGYSSSSKRTESTVAALTATGIGTCGPDDNQAQAGHLIPVEFQLTHPLKAEGADASEDGTGRGTPIIPVYYSHDFNQDRIYADYGVSPALTARDSNTARNIFTEQRVRRLTPVECERLQGFPDDWTAVGWHEFKKCDVLISDTQRYKMLGNAVTVPVAKWIGERILKNYE